MVAAGGDGTLNEVVNGLAPDFCRARLGVIPLGAANDFARAIRVPSDIRAALDQLMAGLTQTVDVGRLTSDRVRYFINLSTGGFSGAVGEQLSEELKHRWGPQAYLHSTLTALPDLSAYYTSVVFDDEEPLTIEAFNVIVANAPFIGGVFRSRRRRQSTTVCSMC